MQNQETLENNPLQYFCMPSGNKHKSAKGQAENLAKWLHEHMKSSDLNAAEMARRSGVSAQSFSSYLNPKPSPNTGKYSLPRRETMIQIAHVFGCPEIEALNAAGYAAPELAQAVNGGNQEQFERTRLHLIFDESKDLTPERQRRLDELLDTVYAEVRRWKSEQRREKG